MVCSPEPIHMFSAARTSEAGLSDTAEGTSLPTISETLDTVATPQARPTVDPDTPLSPMTAVAASPGSVPALTIKMDGGHGVNHLSVSGSDGTGDDDIVPRRSSVLPSSDEATYEQGDLLYGTVDFLLSRLTPPDTPDPVYVDTVLLLYRQFISSGELLEHLTSAYHHSTALAVGATSQGGSSTRFSSPRSLHSKCFIVKIRVLNVLKRWWKLYPDDINKDSELLQQCIAMVEGVIQDATEKDTGIMKIAGELLKAFREALDRVVRLSPGLFPKRQRSFARKSSMSRKSAYLMLQPENAVEFARQLTLIDSELFGDVSLTEFVRMTNPYVVLKKGGGTPRRIAHHQAHHHLANSIPEDDVDQTATDATDATNETTGDAANAASDTAAPSTSQAAMLSVPITSRAGPSSGGGDRAQRGPHLTAISNRFNAFCNWAVATVLQQNTAEQRRDVYVGLLRVAKELVPLNNFNTLLSLLAALTHPTLHRLRESGDIVLSKKDEETFVYLRTLTTPDNNYENIRTQMTRSKKPSIPFLGTYLHSLTKIDEMKQEMWSQGAVLPEDTPRNKVRVNFRKCKYIHDIIADVRQYQESLHLYKQRIPVVSEIRNLLLEFPTLSDQELSGLVAAFMAQADKQSSSD
eukprot:GFYU01005169.1.p1 GENE.GFYU01005169.1~~GFYU01005169.1.p1  ORF type:complete len:635 (-),score=174.40 GFYU01005169.1:110-2014(-)